MLKKRIESISYKVNKANKQLFTDGADIKGPVLQT